MAQAASRTKAWTCAERSVRFEDLLELISIESSLPRADRALARGDGPHRACPHRGETGAPPPPNPPPFVGNPPVHPQHHEMRGVVEEHRIRAIETHLSQAVGVLPAD